MLTLALRFGVAITTGAPIHRHIRRHNTYRIQLLVIYLCASDSVRFHNQSAFVLSYFNL